ncbi:MAG: SPFH domain-containing protein, partial [Gemmatimonadaceae bacterium]
MTTNMSLSLTTIAVLMLGAIVILFLLTRCINILRQYERGVVFRLGKAMKDEKGPGFVFIFWPIDQLVKVSLRVVTWDVPTQDVITRDNVSLKVNAVVYFLVTDAKKAIIAVENFRYAVEQAAQTGLRSVLGEVELD